MNPHIAGEHWATCWTCWRLKLSDSFSRPVHYAAATHKRDNPEHLVRLGRGEGPAGELTTANAERILEKEG